MSSSSHPVPPGSHPRLEEDFSSFSTDQRAEFFWSLLTGPALPHAKLEVMESLYQLGDCTNVEIEFKWIRLGLRARC